VDAAKSPAEYLWGYRNSPWTDEAQRAGRVAFVRGEGWLKVLIGLSLNVSFIFMYSAVIGKRECVQFDKKSVWTGVEWAPLASGW
jgi:hypothetical protein